MIIVLKDGIILPLPRVRANVDYSTYIVLVEFHGFPFARALVPQCILTSPQAAPLFVQRMHHAKNWVFLPCTNQLCSLPWTPIKEGTLTGIWLIWSFWSILDRLEWWFVFSCTNFKRPGIHQNHQTGNSDRSLGSVWPQHLYLVQLYMFERGSPFRFLMLTQCLDFEQTWCKLCGIIQTILSNSTGQISKSSSEWCESQAVYSRSSHWRSWNSACGRLEPCDVAHLIVFQNGNGIIFDYKNFERNKSNTAIDNLQLIT